MLLTIKNLRKTSITASKIDKISFEPLQISKFVNVNCKKLLLFKNW